MKQLGTLLVGIAIGLLVSSAFWGALMNHQRQTMENRLASEVATLSSAIDAYEKSCSDDVDELESNQKAVSDWMDSVDFGGVSVDQVTAMTRAFQTLSDNAER